MLIWGDNKLVTASLLRDFRSKIDLIYIDPPFDVGADFTMSVPIGNEKDAVEKDQSALEMVAYRDMWGKGVDSYLHIMFERLQLMRELLAEHGSIYVHAGPGISSYINLLCKEVFGPACFQNEIVWRRTYAHNDPERYGNTCDSILFYTKSSDDHIWKHLIRCTMQVWTTVLGNTEVIASGKPLSPSTTAIRMSWTPRLRSSLITRSQNLAPSSR
jgi:adenine-specific DNA-methyltransferase